MLETINDVKKSSKELFYENDIIKQLYNNYIISSLTIKDYLASKIIIGEEHQNNFQKDSELYSLCNLNQSYNNLLIILNLAEGLSKIYNVQDSKNINPQWFSSFLRVATLSSDRNLQSMWARVLVKKCIDKNCFRVYELNKLSLIDELSMQAFSSLCKLTFEIIINNQSHYYIPLCINKNNLAEMIKDKSINFSKNDRLKYLRAIPEYNELEILQDIGLIRLYNQDVNISLEKNSIIKFNNTEDIVSDFLNKNNSLKIGYVEFTKTGQYLYEILKDKFKQNKNLYSTLKSYIDFNSNIKE